MGWNGRDRERRNAVRIFYIWTFGQFWVTSNPISCAKLAFKLLFYINSYSLCLSPLWPFLSTSRFFNNAIHAANEVSLLLLLKFAIGHEPEPVSSIPHKLLLNSFLSSPSCKWIFPKSCLAEILSALVPVWLPHALHTVVFLPSLS